MRRAARDELALTDDEYLQLQQQLQSAKDALVLAQIEAQLRANRHPPRCTNAIAEARLWSYKVDRLTGEVLPTLADGQDHLWDASRYGLAPLIKGRGNAQRSGLKLY